MTCRGGPAVPSRGKTRSSPDVRMRRSSNGRRPRVRLGWPLGPPGTPRSSITPVGRTASVRCCRGTSTCDRCRRTPGRDPRPLRRGSTARRDGPSKPTSGRSGTQRVRSISVVVNGWALDGRILSGDRLRGPTPSRPYPDDTTLPHAPGAGRLMRRGAVRLAGFALPAASLWCLIYQVRAGAAGLGSWRPDGPLLLAFVFAHATALPVHAECRHRIVGLFGAVSRRDAWSAHVLSLPARDLPGNVMHLAVRMALMRGSGLGAADRRGSIGRRRRARLPMAPAPGRRASAAPPIACRPGSRPPRSPREPLRSRSCAVRSHGPSQRQPASC